MDRLRLRRLLKGGAIVAAVAVLVVIDRSGSLCAGGGPQPGEVAPDATLPTLRAEGVGPVLRLSALRGKVVLLDFWATWCRSCLRSMPLLERLQDELGAQGLEVVAVNVEGGGERVQRFLQQRQPRLRLTIAIDEGGRVARAYGVHALPHLALIDRTGRLAHVQRGGGDHAELRRRVLSALPVGRNQTRQPLRDAKVGASSSSALRERR